MREGVYQPSAANFSECEDFTCRSWQVVMLDLLHVLFSIRSSSKQHAAKRGTIRAYTLSHAHTLLALLRQYTLNSYMLGTAEELHCLAQGVTIALPQKRMHRQLYSTP